MPKLSAREEFQLSEAVAVYFRLLQWDRAWTAIAGFPELTRDDVDVLGGIAEELGALVSGSVEAAYTVLRLAEIVDPPNQVGEDAGLLPSVATAYNSVIEAAGGVLQLARQAYEGLNAMAPEEQSGLETQLETLRGGGSIAGDLSRKFMCRFAQALMVAGGVTVWVPPHIHAGASIAAGVSIATANRCWELEPFFNKLAPKS